jgi:ketosteroid isomerase-like protein
MAKSQLETVRDLLTVLGKKDTGGAIRFFAAAASYRFGNASPAVGVEQIRQALASSTPDAIQKATVDIKELLEFGDVVVCEMEVSYARKDDSVVTLPCTDLFRFENGLIQDMRIFMDAGPLFAQQQTA